MNETHAHDHASSCCTPQGGCCSSTGNARGAAPAPEAAAETKSASFTCPMHPEVVSSEPGRCPKCRMFLVPVK